MQPVTKRSKREPGRIPLSKLDPHVFDVYDSEKSYFAGKVVVVRRYNASTKIGGVTLAALPDDETSTGRTMEVLFNSVSWSQDYSNLFQTGQHVRFSTQYARVRQAGAKGAAPAIDEQGFAKFLVEYKQSGAHFWIGEDKDDAVPYHFGPTIVKPAGKIPSSALRDDTNAAPQQNSSPTANLGPAKVAAPKGSKGTKRKAEDLVDKSSFTAEKRMGGLSIIYRSLSDTQLVKANERRGWIAVARMSGKPSKSAGTDWKTTLHLQDPSIKDYIVLTIFHKEEGAVTYMGDEPFMLIVHKVARNQRDVDNNFATVYKDSGRYTFLALKDVLTDSIAIPRTSPFPQAKFDVEELSRAKELAQWWQDDIERPIIAPSPLLGDQRTAAERSADLAARRVSGAKRQLVTLENMPGENGFFDVIGEVVRYYRRPFEEQGQLFITDFTPVTNVFEYELERNAGWPGPFGNLVFQISVWSDVDLDVLATVETGDTVLLQNVRHKLNPEGFSEGSIYYDQDSKYQNVPKIFKLGGKHTAYAKQVNAIYQRHVAYFDNFNANDGSQQHMPVQQSSPMSSNLGTILISPGFAELPLSGFDVVKGATQEDVFKIRGRIIDLKAPKLQDWVQQDCSQCDQAIEDHYTCCDDHPDAPLDRYFHGAFLIEDQSGLSSGEVNQQLKVCVTFENSAATLPGLTPSAAMATGDAEIELLCARFASVLGKLEEARRHKREPKVHDYGLAFDMVIRKHQNNDDDDNWVYSFEGTEFRAPA